MRFMASGLHPDHDPLANLRKTFLAEIQALFVQILLLAQTAGVLNMGNISLDGSPIQAEASKSQAVSTKRLGELDAQLRQEVQELKTLGDQADQGDLVLPEGLVSQDEIALRQERLDKLAKARAVLEARAQERYELEKAEYDAQVRQRERPARPGKRKPRGRQPKPPEAGPRDQDQYHFTDPDTRSMKNSTNDGFDQHYNAQLAVDQDRLWIIAQALSNHPNDQKEMEPTLDALSPSLGQAQAAALDNGYFSADNIPACTQRGIEPYIATGREPHHPSWQTFFGKHVAPLPDNASTKVNMAYPLQTEMGRAIYRLRKCTVEPVIGTIKEVLGFRQFSLRGLTAAAGEGGLVCLAFNLKRWHVRSAG